MILCFMEHKLTSPGAKFFLGFTNNALMGMAAAINANKYDLIEKIGNHRIHWYYLRSGRPHQQREKECTLKQLRPHFVAYQLLIRLFLWKQASVYTSHLMYVTLHLALLHVDRTLQVTPQKWILSILHHTPWKPSALFHLILVSCVIADSELKQTDRLFLLSWSIVG